MGKLRDLSGLQFGKLTVINRAENHILPNGKPRTMWNCICCCGKQTTVSGQSLLQHTTVSCGCQQRENFKKPIRDMAGCKFGMLTVEKYFETRVTALGQHKIYWKCICECGNTAIIEGSQLRSGKTQSCGCIKSKGEQIISRVLERHNICFKQNKRMEGLVQPKGGYPLFDFQIFSDDKLVAVIEMQGIQHYRVDKYNESFGKYEREITDPLKREFCKTHNIPLYEIRYDSDIEKETEEIVKHCMSTPCQGSTKSKV